MIVNLIDKSLTSLADVITNVVATPETHKQSFLCYRLALTYQLQGSYAVALKLYQRALKLEDSPKQRSRILVSMGTLLQRAGFEVAAYRTYELALQNNNASAQTWYNLGSITFYRGRKVFRLHDYYGALEWYELTVLFWKRSRQLAPGKYLKAERWLRDYDFIVNFLTQN